MFRILRRSGVAQEDHPGISTQADSEETTFHKDSTPLGELWAGRELGERDFLASDEDMTELLRAMISVCPGKANSGAIANALGSGIEESWVLTNLLCRYLTRNIMSAGDGGMTKILCGEGDHVGFNCSVIIQNVILAQRGSDELRPICTAGVPSVFIKCLIRLHSAAFLAESGRKRDGQGFELQKTKTALHWVLEVLRHVCQDPCCVEDLVRLDSIKGLINLASLGTMVTGETEVDMDATDKVFELPFSKSIELHAADILSKLIVSGASLLLTQHMHQNSLLQLLGEAMKRAVLHSESRPYMFGVRISSRILLQVVQYLLCSHFSTQSPPAGWRDCLHSWGHGVPRRCQSLSTDGIAGSLYFEALQLSLL